MACFTASLDEIMYKANRELASESHCIDAIVPVCLLPT